MQNMSRYFCIGLDEDGADSDYLDEKCAWQIDDIREEFKAAGWTPETGEYRSPFNRGGCPRIASKTVYIDYTEDRCFRLDLSVIVRWGYYEGGCLDIVGEWGNENDAFERVQPEWVLMDDYQCNDDGTPRADNLTEAQAPTVCRMIEAARDELAKEAEGICARTCEVMLRRGAVFDNGEAIYIECA